MKRNIIVCVILSIVTCGIYGLYWLVKLNDEINAMSGQQNATSGVMVIVLSLVTCGIYTYYWMYKMGERVDSIKAMRGVSTSSSNILYLVLTFLGLSIVNYCLMQDEINNNVSASF